MTNGHSGPVLLNGPRDARLDRVRFFAFDIGFLAWMLVGTGDKALRFKPQIPEGSEIVSTAIVQHNGRPHTLLVVYHPSFPVVLAQVAPKIEEGEFDIVLAPVTEAGGEEDSGGTE